MTLLGTLLETFSLLQSFTHIGDRDDLEFLDCSGELGVVEFLDPTEERVRLESFSRIPERDLPDSLALLGERVLLESLSNNGERDPLDSLTLLGERVLLEFFSRNGELDLRISLPILGERDLELLDSSTFLSYMAGDWSLYD